MVITKHGPPEVLHVQDRPDPRPGSGEVMIDVAAAGLTFADVMARIGFYPDAPKPPCVMGYEVAGTIAALGDGVTDLSLGDRVAAGTRFGGHAERVVVPAGEALKIADNLGFAEAAAIPVNYATAWAALVRYGGLQSGERVLIHAAAGGVGIAATQVAKRTGAEVFGTASPTKHDRIRAIGVDATIDYTRRNWQAGLPQFDLVMDAIGGRSFRTSYNLLRPGGRLVCYGAAAVMSGNNRNFPKAARAALRMPRFNLIKQMSASKSVIGLNMLRLWDEHGTLMPWLEPVGEMIDDGTVKPVVAAEIPFDNAAEAHRMIAERRNIGKVVLIP